MSDDHSTINRADTLYDFTKSLNQTIGQELDHTPLIEITYRTEENNLVFDYNIYQDFDTKPGEDGELQKIFEDRIGTYSYRFQEAQPEDLDIVYETVIINAEEELDAILHYRDIT